MISSVTCSPRSAERGPGAFDNFTGLKKCGDGRICTRALMKRRVYLGPGSGLWAVLSWRRRAKARVSFTVMAIHHCGGPVLG